MHDLAEVLIWRHRINNPKSADNLEERGFGGDATRMACTNTEVSDSSSML